MPQPEDWPSADSKLAFDDIADEIERLGPFLRVHGFKATTFGDYLRINHYELQHQLDWLRDKEEDLAKQGETWRDEPVFGADEESTLDTPISLLAGFRTEYELFDFGLLEKTLITCVHRPSYPDQVFSVWRMPKDSRQGRCWQLFLQLRRRGKLPRGILPFEDVLEYGRGSVLVILCRPPSFQTERFQEISPVRALQKTLDGFEALAGLHKLGITINYWPDTNPPTDRLCAEYVYDRNDNPSSSLSGSHGLGWAEPRDEPAYAEIAGRLFTRRVEYRSPESDLPAQFKHAGSDPRLLRAWDTCSAVNHNCAAPAYVSL